MSIDYEERMETDLREMIGEAVLPEIDAVALILLERAWILGYVAAAQDELSSIKRIQATL